MKPGKAIPVLIELRDHLSRQTCTPGRQSYVSAQVAALDRAIRSLERESEQNKARDGAPATEDA